MSGRTREPRTVLVADDEKRLADRYTNYLAGEWDILTAYGGEEARLLLGAEDVEVAVLDRRMPGRSGDELLAYVNEADIDCRVALLTTGTPEFDPVAAGCDERVRNPVSRAELVDVVERLCRLSRYVEKHRRLTAKKLKRNVIAVERERDGEGDRFEHLEAEIESLERELDELGSDLDFEGLQRRI